jgi:hypothetical protein
MWSYVRISSISDYCTSRMVDSYVIFVYVRHMFFIISSHNYKYDYQWQSNSRTITETTPASVMHLAAIMRGCLYYGPVPVYSRYGHPSYAPYLSRQLIPLSHVLHVPLANSNSRIFEQSLPITQSYKSHASSCS